jgi:uncharacterized protein (UPF0335 family)
MGRMLLERKDGDTDMSETVNYDLDSLNAKDALARLITRIEHLEEEKADLVRDIKEVYDEAKTTGFDVGVMRKIVAERRKDPSELKEEAMLLETYRTALLTAHVFDDMVTEAGQGDT